MFYMMVVMKRIFERREKEKEEFWRTWWSEKEVRREIFLVGKFFFFVGFCVEIIFPQVIFQNVFPFLESERPSSREKGRFFHAWAEKGEKMKPCYMHKHMTKRGLCWQHGNWILNGKGRKEKASLKRDPGSISKLILQTLFRHEKRGKRKEGRNSLCHGPLSTKREKKGKGSCSFL